MDLAVELADYGEKPGYARATTTWSIATPVWLDAEERPMQCLGPLDEMQAGGFNQSPNDFPVPGGRIGAQLGFTPGSEPPATHFRRRAVLNGWVTHDRRVLW